MAPSTDSTELSTPQGAAPAGAPSIDDDLPEISQPDPATSLPSIGSEAPVSVATTAPTIRVTTDVLDMEISTRGGTLQRAAILKYPVAKDRPDTVIEMLSPEAAELGLIESGVRSAAGGAEATHLSLFD